MKNINLNVEISAVLLLIDSHITWWKNKLYLILFCVVTTTTLPSELDSCKYHSVMPCVKLSFVKPFNCLFVCCHFKDKYQLDSIFVSYLRKSQFIDDWPIMIIFLDEAWPKFEKSDYDLMQKNIWKKSCLFLLFKFWELLVQCWIFSFYLWKDIWNCIWF